MLLAYAIAALLVGLLFFLSCKMSLALDTKRTFKRNQPPAPRRKRARGAVISSPNLQDAIFALNEKYSEFWATEVELKPDID